jgi:hypothetical protein
VYTLPLLCILSAASSKPAASSTPAILNPRHQQQQPLPVTTSTLIDYDVVTASAASVQEFIRISQVNDFLFEEQSAYFGSLFYADAANKSDFNRMAQIVRAYGSFARLRPEDVLVGDFRLLTKTGKRNVEFFHENFFDIEYGDIDYPRIHRRRNLRLPRIQINQGIQLKNLKFCQGLFPS